MQRDSRFVRALVLPLGVAGIIAVLTPPAGLPQHAWYFFAIFVAIVVALVLEPLPNAAVGMLGVILVAALSRWVLFSPEEIAQPGFNAATRAIAWTLSGFSSPAVWLVFAAFMFGLGYSNTGLGRRVALAMVKHMGHRTLLLGYAVTLFDAVLAPFTPSNTARSAGTVYPIVQHLPALYESHPHSPSARKIGGYLMWTAFAAGCVTSSLFLTALAPNLLAAEIMHRLVHVEVSWTQWFLAAAPFALPLLLLLPLLVYVIYPPETRSSPAIASWAATSLADMGRMSRREWLMAALAILALILWIFAADVLNATTAALIIVALMLITRVVSWSELIAHQQAWDALIRLGTLVTLAEGLQRTGFVEWFARDLTGHFAHLPPMLTAVVLVIIYFLSHYLFATTTAHTVAVFPVVIAVASGIAGLPIAGFALLLALTHGVMGVVSPYATGPSPVYHGSGFITNTAYWTLGAIFGLIFLVALLGLSAPLLLR